ncbi:MAG: DUF4258 domain-containing protein [Nitrospirae bacterium]|nr:DUF4258 domain-containing protein [Nitrospirota bacterium]
MKFEISRHAQEEINRREIPQDLVETILQNPQQIVGEYGQKKAYQSIINMEAGKDYLVRVIVNDTVNPSKVVTVYKTSKIRKYWRQP